MWGTTEGDWLSQFLVPRSETRWLKSVLPLGGSLLLHALLVVPLVLVSFLPRAEAKPPYDAWAGDTFEVAVAAEPTQGAAANPVSQPTRGPSQSESDPEPASADGLAVAAEARAAELVRHEKEAEAKRAAETKRAAEARRAARAKRAARKRHRASGSDRRSAHSKSSRKHPSPAHPRSDAEDAEKPAHSESDARPDPGQRTAERPESGERTGAGSDPTGGGSLGAAGLPKSVRQLPTAFTRVLPRAAVGDSRFIRRPMGEVGDIRFTLHLDAAGKIERAEYLGSPDALLKSLIERTLRFLGKGQFALKEDAGDDLRGTQRVKVHLELKQTSPTPDSDDPSATRSLGFKPPQRSGERVGFGYFELESGLRFEAKITFE